MFIQRVKDYHQWLRSAIPLKTKLGRISSDNVRIQGPSKRPSLGRLHPVSSGKEHYRKGGKCKISRVLQSPVSCTQASLEVETNHRLKQAQHFSTRRKVQDGNSRTVLVATDNSTVVAYINKQGGTHSAEMCALLWRIMTWCHHFHITLKARHIPGCLNVMADLLSRSNQVQSTEWSLHPQVFKQICQKWFTPHVDLFATHLNHKLPRYVSPIPDPKALDIDALNINWTGLTAYAYPPTALLHKVIQKIRQYNCLIILIAPGWPGMPWFWDLVQLSTEIPLQLPVPTTLLKQSHNYVFHSNLPHLSLHAWCLGVDSSKNKASLWRWQRELLPLSGHQQGPSTSQSGPLFEKWCRENSVDFSTPSVKQISDFFLYQDLNRRPSTIDGYRTAIVDTLGPTCQHIAHNEDLHRLLSSFHRDRPESSRNLPSGTFLLFSVSSQKHPLSQ